MKPSERPSLYELASGGNPWECRKCGCRMWIVAESRKPKPDGGPRIRDRECRHCGEPLTTYELPVPPGHKLAVIPDEPEAD